MAEHLVVMRKGEWDGDVQELDHDPEPGERVWYPRRDVLKTGADPKLAYVVRAEVVRLADGRTARVAEFVER